jgi:pimeloyl-ACP methyl ester carboxylesterase
MKIFALLVGINDYPSKPLRGCINDINAVEKFLLDTYNTDNLSIKKLINKEATRQGLIDAFAFFEDAKDGDTCLFYYSGHGSYMTASKEFWTETDGLLETLVCIDSRIENGRDLANKELGFLIWQYSLGKKLNFVVITDSCHSGSVTRELMDENIWRSDRTTPTRNDIIPAKDFYGFDLLVGGERGYTVENQEEVSIKVANHIHLAASRDNQTAKEDEIKGTHHGIFTYSLLQTLYQNNAKINYQNLISLATSRVKNMAFDQDPSLYSNDLDKEKIFLNDEILKSGERFYKVWFDKEKGWCINGGGVNGFQVGDKIKIKDTKEIKISSVGLNTSLFSPPFDVDLDDKEIYDAKVIKNKRIPISFGWFDEFKWDWKDDVATIKEKAQNASDFYLVDDDSGVFFIQEKQESDGAKLFLTPKNSSWALFEKIEWGSENFFENFVSKVDTVCRWYLLRDLDNPNSTFKAENIVIKVEEVGVGEAKLIDGGYAFYYKFDSNSNKWKAPKLKISLSNKTNNKELKAKPIYLNFDYAVDTNTFNVLTLKNATQNIFFTKGTDIKEELSLSLDKKYADLGYNQISEYLKIFVSTKELNIEGYAQEGIALEKNRSAEKADNREIKAKSFGEDPDENVEIDDWQAFTIKFTVTKTSEEELNAEESQKLVSGLELKKSTKFTGKIGFSTTKELKQRDLVEGITHQPQLHEIKGNDIFQPAELVANHGQGQSLNVIEIFDAQNIDAVNDASPLEINPQIPITTNETIIPFGYDPETKSYFPLGITNAEGQIIINQLPVETTSDSAITKRSFTGSIKIFFYKVIGQKIGLKYDYPQLSIADVDENEKLTYEKDVEIIKNRVKNAEKIVLFIHGIIGDTEEMVKVVRRAKTKDGQFLASKFDLVLAFDYENLNTKIQQTADDLKQRLKAVGIDENDKKEFVIIAHSMGGLVSRYFIEKLGGNKVVNHLVMLGTPNGGSEWADVRDLVETLISTAVGGAAFLKPWLIPLSFIGKLLKGSQITLQQMNDKGELSLMPELNDGTDPKIKYTVIAGNTKLLGDSQKIESALKRVIARIKEKPAYAALDIAVFQNEPNDIAVKVKNIKKINQTIPDIFEVASDHISYFGEPKAVGKLGELF